MSLGFDVVYIDAEHFIEPKNRSFFIESSFTVKSLYKLSSN